MAHLQLVSPSDPEPAVPLVKPDNVRLATIRDEPVILELYLADLEENAARVAPISVKHVTADIAKCTRRQGGFALVIDGDRGEPVAFSLSELIPWRWSEKIHLNEFVTYVAPEARFGRLAADLIDGQKWIRQELSAATRETIHLLSGVLATKRTESKIRLFSRHMTQTGAYFIHPSVAEDR